jgi:hypothetical protein
MRVGICWGGPAHGTFLASKALHHWVPIWMPVSWGGATEARIQPSLPCAEYRWVVDAWFLHKIEGEHRTTV